MERLALCSKVLYDYDILEKQRRIVELEKKLKKPKIQFERYSAWDDFKTKMYQDLHAALERTITHNPHEYEHMSYQGLTFRQENAIHECVYEHLQRGTHNVEWSDKVASDALYSVRAMFNALISTHMWMFIYELLDPPDIVELIYEHVTWYLDDDSHHPCVLHGVAEFKCTECGRIHDYVNENQVCVECETTSSISSDRCG